MDLYEIIITPDAADDVIYARRDQLRMLAQIKID